MQGHPAAPATQSPPPRAAQKVSRMAIETTIDLEPLPAAMQAIPTKPTRATGSRWLQMYPDLGLRIGGRCYVWRAAREAIGRGVPLDQAAQIGRACRDRAAA